MSRQLIVRLADDLVEFLDARVEHGGATSRAAVVAAAIDRKRRREMAEQDAAILAPVGNDEDLDGLAAFAVQTPFDDLA